MVPPSGVIVTVADRIDAGFGIGRQLSSDEILYFAVIESINIQSFVRPKTIWKQTTSSFSFDLMLPK